MTRTITIALACLLPALTALPAKADHSQNVAAYRTIVKQAIDGAGQRVCRDRLTLAYNNAPNFVKPYWSASKSVQEAVKVVKGNQSCPKVGVLAGLKF